MTEKRVDRKTLIIQDYGITTAAQDLTMVVILMKDDEGNLYQAFLGTHKVYTEGLTKYLKRTWPLAPEKVEPEQQPCCRAEKPLHVPGCKFAPLEYRAEWEKRAERNWPKKIEEPEGAEKPAGLEACRIERKNGKTE